MLAAKEYGLLVCYSSTVNLSNEFPQSACISVTSAKQLGLKDGSIGVADIKQKDLNLLKLSRTPSIAFYLYE